MDPWVESVPSEQKESMLWLLFRGKMTTAKPGCSVITFLLRKIFSGLWNELRGDINHLSLFSCRSISRYFAVPEGSCALLKKMHRSLPWENYQEHDMCRIPGGRERFLPGKTSASPFPYVSLLPFAGRRGRHIRESAILTALACLNVVFLNNSEGLGWKLLIERGWVFFPLS